MRPSEEQSIGELIGGALRAERAAIDESLETFFTLAGDADEQRWQAALAGVRSAIEALRRHIFLEEEYLFPPLREEFAVPIGVMLREHRDIWRTLAELEAAIATGERSALSPLCDRLAEELDWHNGKEQPIVHAPADQVLDARANAELQRFLKSALLPPGWTCQLAEDRASGERADAGPPIAGH